MPAAIAQPPGAVAIGMTSAAALVLVAAAAVSVLGVLMGHSTCAGASSAPTPAAERGIPARYLSLYRQAGSEYGVPWQILAGIGSIETDHGRSRAPGVRTGVNSHGCCAGPMQFNTRDGPPSTWDRYGVDGDGDGAKDIYDPRDAIASAANYLRVLLRHAGDDARRAIYGYNHSQAYVDDVLARARAYAGQPASELLAPDVCATLDAAARPADLRVAERVTSPRAYRSLPAWAMAAGRAPALVDARLYDDVVFLVRRYRVRLTAGREAGHRTHGDGTGVDLVPADGMAQRDWDASVGRLARDLGWSPTCGHSGSRPACELVPAMQFVGYDGYPGHGSPRTCSGRCPAHLHLSWASPCFGTSSPSRPCETVMVFSTPPSV